MAVTKPNKRFRMGMYVQDSRTPHITYGIGWIDKNGVTIVAPDGTRKDVPWKDAYRYLTVV